MLHDKLWVENSRCWISFELVGQTYEQLLVSSIHEKDQDRTTLYSSSYNYQLLPTQCKFLFSELFEVYQAIKSIAHHVSNVTANLNGEISFQLDIIMAERKMKKILKLELKRVISDKEQLELLKEKVDTNCKEIDQLKQAMRILHNQNSQLKLKYKYLEEFIETIGLKKEAKRKQSHGQSNKKDKQQYLKEIKPSSLISEKKQIVAPQIKVQESSSQKLNEKDTQACLPLKVVIDDKCMYYTKFLFQKNIITSLNEDYYQIYFKEPLPDRGIHKINFKMLARNHLSLGILCQSQQNNQYSFQNNKSICFYAYYDGNFRGIYNRGKYQPLSWNMEVGDIISVELNMNCNTITFWISGHSQAQQVDFSQLRNEEKLYFFLQMYEKNNKIEYI